jgi:hypothetical protein
VGEIVDWIVATARRPNRMLIHRGFFNMRMHTFERGGGMTPLDLGPGSVGKEWNMC